MNIKQIFLTSLACIAMIGCASEKTQHDADIFFDTPEAVEYNVYNFGSQIPVYVVVRKSWDFGHNVKVEIKTDNSVVTDYNKKYKDNLQILSSKVYTVTDSSFVLKDKDKAVVMKIMVDPKTYAQNKVEFNKAYAVGYKLFLDNEFKEDLVVKVGVRQPYVRFSTNLIEQEVPKNEQSLSLKLPIETSFINKDWVYFHFDIDNLDQKVSDYNAKNNTDFASLKKENLVWTKDSLILQRGISSKIVDMFVDGLDSSDKNILIPITITNATSYNIANFTFPADPEYNTLYIRINKKEQ